MALASSRLFQQAPAESYPEKARLLQPPNCELLVRLSHISIATKTDLWLSMASDWAKPKVGGLWFVCWCFPWLKHQEVINPHCDPCFDEALPRSRSAGRWSAIPVEVSWSMKRYPGRGQLVDEALSRSRSAGRWSATPFEVSWSIPGIHTWGLLSNKFQASL